MANEYVVNRDDLLAVANAIRSKAGSSESLTFPNGFTDKINSLEVGGGDGEADAFDAFLEGRRIGTEFFNNRVTKLKDYVFYDTAYVVVTLPNVEKIGERVFESSDFLEKADFSKVTTISQYAFMGCHYLKTLIIGTNSVCVLLNTNAFNSSPIKNGTGYIYVPDELVEQYKVATNWATYANQIKGISELEG